VCLALLREWEGEFSRHADGIGGTDMGEYSTIDFTRYVFFLSYLLWKCTEKYEHAGNIGAGVVIDRGIRIFVFYLYSCLYR